MPRFDWELPYSSQREPVNATSVVATSSPLAAQAGLTILEQGGNAADAAVATAACMTVVEPTTNGIGGDAFAIASMDGALHGINGSGRSPKAIDTDRLLGMSRFPRTGWDPVTVPGCVQAWVDLNDKLGRLEFARCMEPAIRYAREGFLVSPQTASLWQRAARSYSSFDSWNETFLFDGRPPVAGQLVRLPDHARTLESIASSKGASFYRGDLAERIVACARDEDGAMAASDLAEHESLWTEPISIEYRKNLLHEMPPNGQGIAALIALGILRHFDVPSMKVDSPEALHLQIESMKLGFADAHRCVADPDHVSSSPEELLDPDRLKGLAQRIDAGRAQAFDAGVPKPGGTILLCTADAEGNCVSMIQSNYAGFGSGIVIPGTGIAMQNRGACFTLEAGHPNAVGPEKRPYHTIIPGMMTPAPGGSATDLMAFGVMGGFMQPQGHVQVVSRMVDFAQNPQAALDAPRWQWKAGLQVDIEPGLPNETIEHLEQLGHRIRQEGRKSVRFGRGQAIHRLPDGWCGASDLRADGQAVGS